MTADDFDPIVKMLLDRRLGRLFADLTIPKRTVCALRPVRADEVPAIIKDPDYFTERDVAAAECVDCGYRTNSLLLMREHQRNQARVHTIRQRLSRASSTGPLGFVCHLVTVTWKGADPFLRLGWFFIFLANGVAMATERLFGAGEIIGVNAIVGIALMLISAVRQAVDFQRMRRRWKEEDAARQAAFDEALRGMRDA